MEEDLWCPCTVRVLGSLVTLKPEMLKRLSKSGLVFTFASTKVFIRIQFIDGRGPLVPMYSAGSLVTLKSEGA